MKSEIAPSLARIGLVALARIGLVPVKVYATQLSCTSLAGLILCSFHRQYLNIFKKKNKI